ncbi:GNAT family N-acetyltransferase [Halostagnicola sp. A-GB9-2]|uniref:GNAT family N-acetyltransferase n=1 Tax=Halostagnicola sp. A-GB9-2 TaxID=3048066 RepID=UPI0024BF8CBE|nr:GNAT family N-acetyltransferase [Halostagnicola sp. A-GB9-2]MDJ1431186.1 GNAT family N-acetyltransferase [Halostagnicola sp. A-GB9-2]
MSTHPTFSFDDPVQRRVYEYVEQNGAVSQSELARAIRIDSSESHSKPARSGVYRKQVRPSTDQLQEAVDELKTAGYLLETNGRLRVGVTAPEAKHELEDGIARIRPARESDRDELVDAMREVATEGQYVVAENVAERLERESALVRANEDQSRVFFVAEFDPDDESAAGSAEGGSRRAGELVGWLHLDAPELPSLRHTAEVTVGVRPDARREGIGSSLLEYGLEWARDAGYQKITQSLPATNERAIDFLEENGWRREGEREGQYCLEGSFVDEVLLATWLE